MDTFNEVDQKIVKMIMFKVLGEEKRNLRTEKYKETAMVENHIKTIKELVHVN